MISKLLLGSHTHVVCEDTVDYIETTDDISGGIFDGCSTGNSSKWASETFNFLFKRENYNLNDLNILSVIQDLNSILSYVEADFTHAYSTAILFNYDKLTKTLLLRAFGDCSYWVNGVRFDVNANNHPDYIAYHLEESVVNLDRYLKKNPIRTFENVSDFIITSDGIDRLKFPTHKEFNFNFLNSLLSPPNGKPYLERMWNLAKRDGWFLEDDLSIISYNGNGV